MSAVRRLTYFDNSGASVWLDPIDLFLAVEICNAFPEVDQPLSVLEVGVFKGAWILSLGKNLANIERLVGIDPYPGEHQSLRQELPVRVKNLDLADSYTHYDSWEGVGKSEVRDNLPDHFDVIHVDGDHSFEGVARDLKHVDGWLKTSGVLVVDDFFNHYYPGIAMATYKFLEVTDFVMFAMSKNKAYACRREHHDEWLGRLSRKLDDSPLSYSVVDWRGLDEKNLESGPTRNGSPKILLCLDENHRSSLLPTARDRRMRSLAKDWLPPKIGSWVRARGGHL